jgi:hypothetical protein
VKPSRILVAAIVSAVAALSLCANAGAANVTVGPSLTSGEWFWEECEFAACTFVNTNLAGSGPNLTSPVSGAIVGFSVLGGATPGTYRLSTVTPVTEFVFGFSKRSAPVTAVPSEEVETYATSLPINAGQTIGLSMSEGASVGFLENVGGFCWWASEPAESGPAGSHNCFTEVVGFNAEIQPAPTISSLGTTSGSTTGGTSVTISGTDLENATSVSFGSVPAASYTVNSESQITAVAPARESAASVSVTVTTIAGKAIASQQFGYVAPPPPPVVITPVAKTKKTTQPVKQCLVPKLKGKKLPAAKSALKKGDCKAGKVTKLKGATPKTGKVAAQSRKAGAKATAGAKVNLTLKP